MACHKRVNALFRIKMILPHGYFIWYVVFILNPEGTNMQVIVNGWGPDRLSWLYMAETVVAIKDYELSLLKPVFAWTVSLP